MYCTLDLSKEYWKFPLNDYSQASPLFITPDGILSPTRVLLGTKMWCYTYSKFSRRKYRPLSINYFAGWMI